jgi:hypothetical protein
MRAFEFQQGEFVGDTFVNLRRMTVDLDSVVMLKEDGYKPKDGPVIPVWGVELSSGTRVFVTEPAFDRIRNALCVKVAN